MEPCSVLNNKARLIKNIAKEIKNDWKNVYYGAKPYLDAMSCIENITDKYFYESSSSIVVAFLANATHWRGEVARRIKKELNEMLKTN
jgi:hypothetical protein